MKGDQASPFLIEALGAWGLGVQELHASISTGLINETYEVRLAGAPMILQRVHTVFAPEIHQNIRAVSEQLNARGVLSPQLVARPSGEDVFVDSENRCWRMQDFVPGCTLERIEDRDQAHAAAGFLARWHGALADLEHRFVGIRSGVHDTPAHRKRLVQALQDKGAHPLFEKVRGLADGLFALLDALPPLPSLALAVAHGDPKVANLRFFADQRRPKAWIDLDTVGPMLFAHEMGDALRSWCNPGLEDAKSSEVDLERFEAAVSGYADEVQGLSPDQAQGMLWGPCWISAELALRFAADALQESYFGWDPQRYASRGEHNLARAQAQFELARSFVGTVGVREGWV